MRLSHLTACVVVCTLGLFGATAAWADGGFLFNTSPETPEVTEIQETAGPDGVASGCVTEDVSTDAALRQPITFLEIVCTQTLAQRTFIWQLCDLALSPDPLTISYLPPEQLTLSFDIDHPRNLPTYTLTRLRPLGPGLPVPLTAASAPAHRLGNTFTILAQTY